MQFLFSLIYLFILALSIKAAEKPTADCIAWGLICSFSVQAQSETHNVSSEEADDLWNFMKFGTLKLTQRLNRNQINWIRNETQSLEAYLPREFREDWQAINDQPQEPPELVVHRDALNPANYI